MTSAFTNGLLKEAFDFDLSKMMHGATNAVQNVVDKGKGMVDKGKGMVDNLHRELNQKSPLIFNRPAVDQQAAFKQMVQPNPGATNSYRLQGFPKPDTRINYNGLGEPGVKTLPFGGPNTLVVNAHGSGGPGKFKLMTEGTDGTNPIELAFQKNNNIGTFEDIASALGPATNNIHNIQSMACNRDGGCTPEYLRTLYPNVTNIVETPPGFYGPMLPKNINPQFGGRGGSGDLEKAWMDSAQDSVKKQDVLSGNQGYKNLLDSLNTGKVQGTNVMEHLRQYMLQGGTNWVDKGRYRY